MLRILRGYQRKICLLSCGGSLKHKQRSLGVPFLSGSERAPSYCTVWYDVVPVVVEKIIFEMILPIRTDTIIRLVQYISGAEHREGIIRVALGVRWRRVLVNW